MQPLEQKILEQFKIKSCQSVRHLVDMNTSVAYAIFITNRYRKIGWIAEVNGKYYGTFSTLVLKDKDDIIDYYLAMDDNAKKTIQQLCRN